jgi:rare lipoprotein A
MKKILLYILSATLLFSFYGCASKKPEPACVIEVNTPKTSTVKKMPAGKKMKGISSWYGKKFHGSKTSNGEIYNMHAKTAAHKTLPMHTMVKVTNIQNGKSTVVRINDRGPFVRGRIIDCSYAAGKELGLDRLGIAKVEIEVLGYNGKIQKPNG